MNTNDRFRCPACGFPVFNRRVAKCESCLASLPAKLLFTSEELAVVEADHESNEIVRQQLFRDAKEREELESKKQSYGGIDGGFPY